MFKLNEKYSKKDIYKLLNVPEENQKGAWDTGYREYNGDIFIFANIGVPGRTGHDHNNYWDNNYFLWEAKDNSNINQPMIQKMITGKGINNIYLFTRTDNSDFFTYEGILTPCEVKIESPIKIKWLVNKK